MTVVRLPGAVDSGLGGSLVYSPVLDVNDSMEGVLEELGRWELLPVRYVLAPSPQHHFALAQWQSAFPDAALLCGAASGQMPPLTRKRRDLRFDGVLRAAGAGGGVGGGSSEERRAAMMQELGRVFEIAVLDDNRSGEVVLLHRPSGTLILSDALYKSTPEVVGPGGTTGAGAGGGACCQQHAFTAPQWFAEGQEELFYGRPTDNSGGLLPSYRTHPRMRTIDVVGMRRSLEAVLAWPLERAVCCHTDPIDGGDQVKSLLRRAWGWLWSEER